MHLRLAVREALLSVKAIFVERQKMELAVGGQGQVRDLTQCRVSLKRTKLGKLGSCGVQTVDMFELDSVDVAFITFELQES